MKVRCEGTQLTFRLYSVSRVLRYILGLLSYVLRSFIMFDMGKEGKVGNLPCHLYIIPTSSRLRAT